MKGNITVIQCVLVLVVTVPKCNKSLARRGARNAPLPARATPWQFLLGAEKCCHDDRLGIPSEHHNSQYSAKWQNHFRPKARHFAKRQNSRQQTLYVLCLLQTYFIELVSSKIMFPVVQDSRFDRSLEQPS